MFGARKEIHENTRKVFDPSSDAFSGCFRGFLFWDCTRPRKNIHVTTNTHVMVFFFPPLCYLSFVYFEAHCDHNNKLVFVIEIGLVIPSSKRLCENQVNHSKGSLISSKIIVLACGIVVTFSSTSSCFLLYECNFVHPP